jgi:hypothetical protein
MVRMTAMQDVDFGLPLCSPPDLSVHVNQPKALVGGEVYYLFNTVNIYVDRILRRLETSVRKYYSKSGR